MLSDDSKRRQYDAYGQTGGAQGGGQGFQGFSGAYGGQAGKGSPVGDSLLNNCWIVLYNILCRF